MSSKPSVEPNRPLRPMSIVVMFVFALVASKHLNHQVGELMHLLAAATLEDCRTIGDAAARAAAVALPIIVTWEALSATAHRLNALLAGCGVTRRRRPGTEALPPASRLTPVAPTSHQPDRETVPA